MRPFRFRLVQLSAAAILVATAGISLLQTTPARADQHRSAAQFLSQAFADARAETSFHEVSTEVGGGHSVSFVNDVGTNSGRQHITRSDGTVANVEVTGGDAYFAGNRTALVTYFELPSSDAAVVGSHWVSLTPSDRDYQPVADGVTLQSALAELAPPSTGLTEGPQTTIDGQAVIGISGKLAGSTATKSATATFYITTGDHPLPVEVRTVGIEKPRLEVVGTVALSNWGERVAVSPPTSSIPLDKIVS
jgi:hypothetical protein